jgi:hypothetical protein
MWNPHIIRNDFLPDRDRDIVPSDKDTEVLRRLAEQCYTISQKPVMEERKKLWTRLNDLDGERPMILADPEGAWIELIPTEELQCSDPILREWELRLRKAIFNFENIGDDDVVEPWFDISWDVRIGNHGVEVVKHQGENRGSYTWDKPLRNLHKDLEKLSFRSLVVNRKNTLRDKAVAEKIFKDILPVKIRGKYWWSVGMTSDIIHLLGLQEFMMFMYDDPDGVKRLLDWFSREYMHFIQWFEDEQLLSDTNTNDYVGSGGIAYTGELPKRTTGARVSLSDIWGHCESQETVGISPEMFGEYIFPYQLPLIERFGLACYGCCEPVELRLPYILKAKNVRRISVSAWADEEACAEALGKKYIYSRKPNPAHVSISFDEKEIRSSIRKTLRAARGCNLEFNMKDTHTLENDRTRMRRWVAIVRQEVEKEWGV